MRAMDFINLVSLANTLIKSAQTATFHVFLQAHAHDDEQKFALTELARLYACSVLTGESTINAVVKLQRPSSYKEILHGKSAFLESDKV